MKPATKFFLFPLLLVLLVSIIVSASGFTYHKRTIETYIEKLDVGELIYYENMTIAPVYSRRVKDYTHYTTLEEALRKDWLDITELDRGQVPNVRVSNRSNRHIFLMGGEIISGGKQDRIISRDVLLGPRSRNVIIPVYCTEEGRWQNQSKKFYSKNNLGTSRLRSAAQYADSGAQHSIWSEIATTNRKLGVRSRSKAYQSAYEDDRVQRQIKRYERNLSDIPNMHPDTVGVVIAVGNDIISVDLFVNPDLFKKLWPKILRSSALSAVNHDNVGQINVQDAVRVLRRIHDAKYRETTAIDLGLELSAKKSYLNINALIYHDQLLHLAAFPRADRPIKFKAHQQLQRRQPVYQSR